MKILPFSILLIICAFQVRFTLSDENSWTIKFNQLKNLTGAVRIAEQKFEYYIEREYNYTHVDIHNFATSLTNVIVNAALNTLREVKNLVLITGCNTGNCLSVFYQEISNEVDKINNTLTQNADDKIEAITRNSELYYVKQNMKEIRNILHSESEKNTSSCLKENKNSYHASEACLLYKIFKVQLILDIINEKEKYMNAYILSLEPRVRLAKNNLNLNHFNMLVSVVKPKKKFCECLSNICQVLSCQN